MPILSRRRNSAPQEKPWISNRDGKRVAAYRQRYPHRVATHVWVVVGNGSRFDPGWVETDWSQRDGDGLPDLHLRRTLQDPRKDWASLVRLACWAGGYDEARCATIQQAIWNCKPTQTCRLTITPKAFAFKDFADRTRPVTLVEGTF